jgi:hypothetical protein
MPIPTTAPPQRHHERLCATQATALGGHTVVAAVCAAVDWLVAVVLAIEIIAGAGFHH